MNYSVVGNIKEAKRAIYKGADFLIFSEFSQAKKKSFWYVATTRSESLLKNIPGELSAHTVVDGIRMYIWSPTTKTGDDINLWSLLKKQDEFKMV